MTAVTDLIAQLLANRTVQNPAGEAIVANTDTFIAALLELAGGGGGGSPGGNPGDVQFNDAGAFGGNDTFIWNDATKALQIVTTEGTFNFSADDSTSFTDISYRGTFAFGGSLSIAVGDGGGTNNQSIAMNVGQFVPMFVEDGSPSGDGLTVQSVNGPVNVVAGTTFTVTAATQADITGGASLISFGTDVNIGSNGSINLTSDTGIISLDGANGVFCFRQFAAGDGILGLTAVDLASLPVPNAGQAFSVITDALTPVAGAVAVGGGAVIAPVYYDGTDWRILVVPV